MDKFEICSRRRASSGGGIRAPDGSALPHRGRDSGRPRWSHVQTTGQTTGRTPGGSLDMMSSLKLDAGFARCETRAGRGKLGVVCPMRLGWRGESGGGTLWRSDIAGHCLLETTKFYQCDDGCLTGCCRQV